MYLNKREVTFYSAGYRIQGTINLPKITDESSKLPSVIFSHGYASNRDEFGDFLIITEKLNKLGIASLLFDYSGCGITEFPLGEILCATNWKEDLKAAVSFISSFPGIDPERIAVIGSSMGGTNAINTTAEDQRIKCVIAMSSIADGFHWIKENWLNNKEKEEYEKFISNINEDRKRKAIYGFSNFIKITEALAYKDRYNALLDGLHKELDDRIFTYYVKYESIDSIMSINILDKVTKISPRPLMLLAGKIDEAVPWEKNSKELFDKAGQKKKFILVEDADHSLIAGNSREFVIMEILDWLNNYL
jgi:uncharacterized protein